MGLTLCIIVIHGEEPEMSEEIDVPPIPIWTPTVTVTTGGGYKDNLLLSHVGRESSPFVKNGLEFFLMRLPLDGPQLNFSVTGDDVRYLSGKSVDGEQLFATDAKVTQEIADGWEGSFGVSYVYLDEVLDVSVSETNRSALKVRTHQLQGGPGITRSLGEFGAITFTVPVARHWFAAPLDDSWETGPRLAFSRAYGNGSEWIASFIYNYRQYDTRARTDELGNPIPDTRLAFQQHQFDLGWRHYIDAQKQWRISTRLSYRLNQDNGGGYFDYVRFQVSEQLRYHANKWDLSAEARLAFYKYVTQQASPTDSSTRERAELGCHLRVERELLTWLRLFADYEYEQVLSNQSFEEYSVNTVTAGLMWEF